MKKRNTLIEVYEEQHHSIADASPLEVLRALMDANDLRQKDFVPIFGSESIVSEVLHKKPEWALPYGSSGIPAESWCCHEERGMNLAIHPPGRLWALFGRFPEDYFRAVVTGTTSVSSALANFSMSALVSGSKIKAWPIPGTFRERTVRSRP